MGRAGLGFGRILRGLAGFFRAARLASAPTILPTAALAADLAPETFGLGGLLTLCLAGLGFVGWRWRGARRRAAVAEDALAQAHAVAFDAPGQVIVWPVEGEEPSCPAALAAALRFSAGAVDADSLIGIFRPAHGARLGAALDALRAQGTAFVFDRLAAADGKSFRAEGRRLATGGAALWLTDVTEAAAAEDGLRNEPDRLARVLDALPVAVWRRGGDQRIVAGNSAYARAADAPDVDTALARGAEILTGRGLNIARRAASDGAAQAERHHVVIDGKRRLLEFNEMPDGATGELIGYALDYTDVEEAEGELARHVDSHREVLEHLGVAIAIFGADMRLKFLNTAYARQWRFDEAWLASEPAFDEILED